MPAPQNPGVGPQSEQPAVGAHPLRRFREQPPESPKVRPPVTGRRGLHLYSIVGVNNPFTGDRGLHVYSIVGVNNPFTGDRGLHLYARIQSVVFPTFAGKGHLSATFAPMTDNIAVTIQGRSTLTPRVRATNPFTLGIAGTSSISVAITKHSGGTLNLVFIVNGIGQLREGIGPVDLSPVIFSGTSSLDFGVNIKGKIRPTFAGVGHLSVNLHRAQFLFQIHGLSSLTFGPYTFTNPGGHLSQVAVEAATQNISTARLSQVTLEVLRERSGLHVWHRF